MVRGDRARWTVAAIAGAAGSATVAETLRWAWFVHPDFLIARRAAGTLLSSRGLLVYLLHPRAQMGPLALVAATLPHVGYGVVVAALVVPFLLAVRASSPRRDVLRHAVFGVGAALLVVPWSQLAWKGHADDALVLLGASAVLLALATGRKWLALAGYAVALAGKPTGVVLLPLLLGSSATALNAVAITAAVWLPFVLATPRAMLAAGRGVMPVAHGSAPALLGVGRGAAPEWIRITELVAGLAASILGHLRRRPAAALLLAFAVRALLEPNPAPAYAIPLVALALPVDLAGGWLLAVPLAAVSFWTSQPVLDGGPAWWRLVPLLALAGYATLRLASPGGASPVESGFAARLAPAAARVKGGRRSSIGTDLPVSLSRQPEEAVHGPGQVPRSRPR